jgi:ribonuclease HI
MAKQLWEAMREVWPLKAIDTIPYTGTEWPLHALAQVPEQERMMMLMTWWRIWHAPNEVVHQKAAPPVEASRIFLCSYVDSLLLIKQNPGADPAKGKFTITYDHMLSRGHKRTVKQKARQELKRWSKPPPGWVKLNVDGSWVEEGHKGGTGLILRDEEGSILAAASRHLKTCASPLEAETQACIDGLSRLSEWTNKMVILETDCQELVAMINDVATNRIPVAALVNSTKRLCQERNVGRVQFVSRDLNTVSHTLARLGCTSEIIHTWIREGPDVIKDACIQDQTPLP